MLPRGERIENSMPHSHETGYEDLPTLLGRGSGGGELFSTRETVGILFGLFCLGSFYALFHFYGWFGVISGIVVVCLLQYRLVGAVIGFAVGALPSAFLLFLVWFDDGASDHRFQQFCKAAAVVVPIVGAVIGFLVIRSKEALDRFVGE